jgi:NAD(P) transhydrogenase
MTLDKYDLVIIGSGPAGEKAAARAAYFGKRVAMIEKEPVLGGAAANTGTLPSKTLRESALFLSGFRQRELFGLQFGLKESVTVRDFLARERLVKENERARIMENLKRHRVTLYKGTARFVDAHTLSVQPQRCPEFHVQGDFILIATGSYPYRPPGFPFHDPRVYDSDTIVTLHEIPPTMLVVGGGVIGCEYACMFAALGVKVTLVEKRGGLVGFLDAEVAAELQAQMEAMGIRMFLFDGVAAVEPGERDLKVRLLSGPELETHTILVSSGRCGNTEGLGLDRIGVPTQERGHITVNEAFQTAVPHVYAAGDVIGFPSLASTAMEQGRIAISNAFGLEYSHAGASKLPYGLYTIPECSMVGETEEGLTKQKIPFVVGRAHYGANARGQIIGDRRGFLKLLFHEEDMTILGVHMIGEQATELIHVGLTAMLCNATVDLFIQTCYNYPTLTEMYKYAAYDALGRRNLKREGRPQPTAPTH